MPSALATWLETIRTPTQLLSHSLIKATDLLEDMRLYHNRPAA